MATEKMLMCYVGQTFFNKKKKNRWAYLRATFDKITSPEISFLCLIFKCSTIVLLIMTVRKTRATE